MEEPFPGAKNTLPWLDEQSNMRKEKNFFETRVAEYQTGAIKRSSAKSNQVPSFLLFGTRAKIS